MSTPKEVLWEDYYEGLHSAHHAMNAAFRESGMTQDDLALVLGIDKSLVSRQLNGTKKHPTLKSMSAMATAMGYRVKIIFVPYRDLS